MFHLILTLVYTIPCIYVFFRIKGLFISSGYKWYFTAIFLIAASFYPLSQVFEHRETHRLVQAISTISNYLLPFFLYLFLQLLAYEVFLIVNRIFRIAGGEKRRSFSYRFYMLTAMIGISIAIVVGGVINLNTIRNSEYEVIFDKESPAKDQFRIVFVSDIHINEKIRTRFIENLVYNVNELKPDLMLFGGDIVEGDSDMETIARIGPVLAGIRTTNGKFGVPGNHEYYGGDGQSDFYRASKITLLHDTVIRIENICYLAGRNDEHTGERKPIDELLDSVPDDLPVIVLDHRPREILAVSETRADMQFSGHTHHGQLFPINLITRHVYELSWGYRKINNTHFFVSSGLRLWGPPVKTSGKAEVIVVDVVCRQGFSLVTRY